MSCLGKPEFEFERLCSVFGIASIRRAMSVFPKKLRYLEDSLAFIDKLSEEFVSDNALRF